MNDDERRLWVENDEGLYDLWRASGRPQRSWIRANRALIDRAVCPIERGEEQPHYLKYGRGRAS